MKKLVYIMLFVCSISFGQSLPILQKLAYTQSNLGPIEIYNWNDAATPTPNELNTVVFSTSAGWDATQDTVISSDATDPQNGIYAIKIESGAIGGYDFATLSFQVTVGNSYTLTFWAKRNATGDGRLRQSFGWVSGPAETQFTNTWTEYSFNLEASATTAGIYLLSNRLDSTTLNSVLIDNITLTKI